MQTCQSFSIFRAIILQGLEETIEKMSPSLQRNAQYQRYVSVEELASWDWAFKAQAAFQDSIATFVVHTGPGQLL